MLYLRSEKVNKRNEAYNAAQYTSFILSFKLNRNNAFRNKTPFKRF